MNLDYGEILKKSWKTIWKFKILWIFGIFASCSAGRSGSSFNSGGSYNGGNSSTRSFGKNNPQLPPEVNQFFMQVNNWFNPENINNTIAIIILVLLILFLMFLILRLLSIAVGTVGKIGLINGAWSAEEGAEKIGFGSLLGEGWKSFWPVILFKLVLWGFRIVLGIVLFVLIIMTLFTALCLIIPLSIVFGYVYWILVELIMVGIVGEKLGVFEAISRAWNLFKNNWVTTCLMGLILGVIEFVYHLIVAIPVILIVIAAAAGVYLSVSGGNESMMVPVLIIAGILLLTYIFVAIFLGGIKEAYMSTNWTIIFRRLTGRSSAIRETLDAGIAGDNPPVLAG